MGDHARGVALLTDLFLDTNNPNFIYNQGRCFEQNHRYEDALARFREYLLKAKPLSAAEKADTESHIAACQSYLKEKSAQASHPETSHTPAAPAKTEAPPSVIKAEPPPARPEPAEVAPVVAYPAPAPDSETAVASEGSGLRLAGWVVAAVGAASGLTGLLFNLQANKMASDVEKNYNASTDSKRESFEIWGWVAYGTGAACLVGGSILYLVGRSMGSDSSVALVPSFASGAAGTTLIGTF